MQRKVCYAEKFWRKNVKRELQLYQYLQTFVLFRVKYWDILFGFLWQILKGKIFYSCIFSLQTLMLGDLFVVFVTRYFGNFISYEPNLINTLGDKIHRE